MKKSIVFVIMLSLIFALAACGGSLSPTEVTTNYFESVKAQDFEKMSKYYAGEVEDMDLSSTDSALESEDFDFLSAGAIEEKMLDFDYKIVSEEISEDEKTATVEVSITSYAFGGLIEDLISDAITQAFANMFDENFDIEKYMEEKMAKDIEKLEKDFNDTVTIDLQKDKDGNWVVSEFDDDSPLVNAISGGMIDAISGIEDSFSDLE